MIKHCTTSIARHDAAFVRTVHRGDILLHDIVDMFVTVIDGLRHEG